MDDMEDEDGHDSPESHVIAEYGFLPTWSPLRISLAKVLNHIASDLVLSAVVFFNLVIVVVETDDEARGNSTGARQWVIASNFILLTFYVCEVAVRLFTYRMWFFTSQLNNFDLAVISVDLLVSLLESFFGHILSLSFLRVFRLTRLRRSVNVMMINPELSLLLRGLMDTGKTLFWGTLLILVTLLMWSFVAVQYIYPIALDLEKRTDGFDGCDRCVHAFSSVMQACLTFYQQLVVGEGWGEVTVLLIEYKPALALFFIVVHVTVSIGLMNLLLAVIVDRAQSARSEDVKEIIKHEKRDKDKMRKRLQKVFLDMDKDGSGSLTLSELKKGFKTNLEFRTILKGLDVEELDLEIVFSILQQDIESQGDGALTGVNYDNFVEQLWKMKTQDQHTLLIFIKFYITDVRNRLLGEVKMLDEQLVAKTDRIQASVYDLAKPFLYAQKELGLDSMALNRQGSTGSNGSSRELHAQAAQEVSRLRATRMEKELNHEVEQIQLIENELKDVMMHLKEHEHEHELRDRRNGYSDAEKVLPGAVVDVQEIVDSVTKSISKELVPLQRFAEEISTMMQQSLFSQRRSQISTQTVGGNDDILSELKPLKRPEVSAAASSQASAAIPINVPHNYAAGHSPHGSRPRNEFGRLLGSSLTPRTPESTLSV